MIHLIQMDLNVAFRRKGFQISFLVLVLYALFVSLFYAFEQRGYDVSELYHPAVLSGINSYCDYAGIFHLLFPFLAVMPGGFLLFNDKSTKTNLYLLSRKGRRQYYFSKTVAAFLAAFLAFTLPFLMELLLNLLIFPQNGGRMMSGWPMYSEVTMSEIGSYAMFGSLFARSVYLYYLCALLLLGVFAGCASVFVLGISTFRLGYKVLLFLPMFLLNYILNNINSFIPSIRFKMNLDDYYCAYGGVSQDSKFYFAAVMLALLAVGIALVCLNGICREDDI